MSNDYQGRQRYPGRSDAGRREYDLFGRETSHGRGRSHGPRQSYGADREGYQGRDRGDGSSWGDDRGRPQYDALGRYYEEDERQYQPGRSSGQRGHGDWREEQAGHGARLYGERDFPSVGEHDYRGMHRQYGQHQGDHDDYRRRGHRSWEEHYDDGGEYGSYPSGQGQRQASWRASGPGQGVVSRSADPGQSSYGGFTNEDPSYQYQQRQPGGYPGDQEYRVPRMGEPGPWQRSGGHQQDSSYGENRQWYGEDAHRDHRRGWGAQSQRRTSPKGYTRSDDRVREDICERLSHSGLDVSEVSVEVKDGTVTLEGTVEDRWTKYVIEDHADDCLGVKEIDNRIRVLRSQGYSRGETSTHAGGSSQTGSEGRSEQGSGSSASAGGGSGQHAEQGESGSDPKRSK